MTGEFGHQFRHAEHADFAAGIQRLIEGYGQRERLQRGTRTHDLVGGVIDPDRTIRGGPGAFAAGGVQVPVVAGVPVTRAAVLTNTAAS